MCLEFDKETSIGGEYEVLQYVSYLELKIVPCEVVAPGDCQVEYGGAMVSTLDSVDPVLEYLKDFTLDIFVINDEMDVSNFKSPLARNLIHLSTYRINGLSTTIFNHEYSYVQVKTESAFIKTKTEVQTGLKCKSAS
jgi:hypothetical protein